MELMKGSLNTFLNAFTYPDRTCYPVRPLSARIMPAGLGGTGLALFPASVWSPGKALAAWLLCIGCANLGRSRAPSHPPAPLPTHPPVRWPAATCRTFTTWLMCTWMPCSTRSAQLTKLLARFCAPRQPACKLACIQAAGRAGLGCRS